MYVIIYDLVTFDLIPTDPMMEWLRSLVGEYDNADKHDNHISQQTKDMGYNTTNPIQNVFGTAIIVVIASLLAFVVLLLLKLALEVGIPEINGPL